MIKMAQNTLTDSRCLQFLRLSENDIACVAHRLVSAILAIAVCLVTATAANASGYSFTPLESFSRAYGVSADGTVVVGYLEFEQAFRWTRSGGISGLGDLPGGSFNSVADAASADGAVIVGSSSSASGGQAFRWTAASGMVGLGDLPGGSFESTALAVSDDGTIVVGAGSTSLGGEAFRWTAATGMVGLGRLPAAMQSAAHDMSADGVVVGESGGQAFRWTSGAGMTSLGTLVGQNLGAYGVSADGSVIVGGPLTGSSGQAFRWTSNTGIVGLGDFPEGNVDSTAYDVSADGSVIVGRGRSASANEAFVWTVSDGMLNLRSLLVAGGAQGLQGWTFETARGVSADGRTIVGWGIGPRGFEEAWVATIGDPPYTLVGDANSNGIVDNADLAILVANFGTTAAATRAQGDFDNNGRVNLQDLRLLKNHFGDTLSAPSPAPSADAIPEPASCALALLAIALILALRARTCRDRIRS